jgi:hypothetical protein
MLHHALDRARIPHAGVRAADQGGRATGAASRPPHRGRRALRLHDRPAYLHPADLRVRATAVERSGEGLLRADRGEDRARPVALAAVPAARRFANPRRIMRSTSRATAGSIARRAAIALTRRCTSAFNLADNRAGGIWVSGGLPLRYSAADCSGIGVRPTSSRYRMFTARAASSARMVSEISDCSIISPLAHRFSTGVSVGENAVLVLNARNR